MKVRDLIETYCDEDELFVINDNDGDEIARIWKSDYRINKDKYQYTTSLEIEGWASEMTHICIWTK